MPSHKILRILPSDIPARDLLANELSISKVLAQTLINRGINSIKEASEFLDSKAEQLLDPYSFKDMEMAVGIVKKAAGQKERIMVFGDYDVDGITALALLEDVLKRLGIDCMHYLPHRIKEGYGLSKNIVLTAKQHNVRVVITVDCGISNHKEIEELRRNNIDVIITDHHEPTSNLLPPASSIINPKLKDSNYGFRDLAGVGVAYKFCQALTGSKLLEELDLVALGTITDSVPLIGENRIIAKEGLSRLSKTNRPGLKALIETAGIENRKFTAMFVSFIIGPRLNASGRIDTAETSLKLLMSRTRQEAEPLAKAVEAYNRQRQKIESKIMEEAEELINREINFKEHKVIVIAKDDWHQGVLGIVASKLADRFFRPAIVISLSEDLCKGSARSIKNFHIFKALSECRQFLSSFGGHSHAAGLVISRDSIKDFKHSINRLAHESLTIEDLLPSLDIDMELKLTDLTIEAVLELERLEPFGAGNPEPLFYTKDLKLKGEPQILSRDTLKFWVTDGAVTYPAIGFGLAGLRMSLVEAGDFDLVYTPRIDYWLQDPSVILEVKDIFF